MKMRLNRLSMLFLLAGGLASAVFSPVSYAHHPNEGDWTLPSLLEDAFKNNLEIKEAEQQQEVSSALRKQAVSAYLPHLSLDGGAQSNRFDSEQSSGVFGHVSANINLYRGGRDKINQEVLSAEESFQKFRYQKTRARIQREVSKKYYELLYLSEGIALKEEALETNKNSMALAQKKKAAGFTSQADVLEFELRESNLKSDLNLLRQEEATKTKELARLIGYLGDKALRVKGHLERTHLDRREESLLTQALEEREDLKEAQKALAVSELEYKGLFADYLPRIDLKAKYGKLATEERVSENLNNFSVGLQVSIPIFSGLDTLYGRDAKAKDRARNDYRAERIKQEVKVQLETALSRLKSIDERLDLEEKNIARSRQYYDLTLSEYRKGVKNSPDVAGAAERLYDAKLRNLGYRRDYYLTNIEIAEATGVGTEGL
jgi:outer membrane protein TolC